METMNSIGWLWGKTGKCNFLRMVFVGAQTLHFLLSSLQ